MKHKILLLLIFVTIISGCASHLTDQADTISSEEALIQNLLEERVNKIEVIPDWESPIVSYTFYKNSTYFEKILHSVENAKEVMEETEVKPDLKGDTGSDAVSNSWEITIFNGKDEVSESYETDGSILYNNDKEYLCDNGLQIILNSLLQLSQIKQVSIQNGNSPIYNTYSMDLHGNFSDNGVLNGGFGGRRVLDLLYYIQNATKSDDINLDNYNTKEFYFLTTFGESSSEEYLIYDGGFIKDGQSYACDELYLFLKGNYKGGIIPLG